MICNGKQWKSAILSDHADAFADILRIRVSVEDALEYTESRLLIAFLKQFFSLLEFGLHKPVTFHIKA